MYRKSGMVAILALALSVTVACAGDKTFAIGDQEAIRAALDKTGGGNVMELRLERDAEAPVYSLLIVDDVTRFDVRVDAATGDVIKFAKRDIQGVRSIPRGMVGGSHQLTPEAAVQSALAASDGGVLVRSDLARKSSGRSVYDMEVIKDNTKYTMEVDANNGAIVHYEERKIQGATTLAMASK